MQQSKYDSCGQPTDQATTNGPNEDGPAEPPNDSVCRLGAPKDDNDARQHRDSNDSLRNHIGSHGTPCEDAPRGVPSDAPRAKDESVSADPPLLRRFSMPTRRYCACIVHEEVLRRQLISDRRSPHLALSGCRMRAWLRCGLGLWGSAAALSYGRTCSVTPPGCHSYRYRTISSFQSRVSRRQFSLACSP
jgi:hypothetical protein